MAEAEETPAESPPKKSSKKGLLIGLVLALVLGGGGFYATWSGLILGGDHQVADSGHAGPAPLPDIAFVVVDPITIALGQAGRGAQLRMQSQLEVDKAQMADVTLLMPRVLDVLNGYLRAVDVAEIENPAALVRLRAQMLRRVQTVVGDGRVRDLLITEFVVN